MKKSILLMLCILFFISVHAEDKKTKSKITDVTVYRQNAKITRTASTQVSVGISKITFESLETVIQAQSIQVKMSKGVKLLSVSYSIDYLKNKELSREYKILSDSSDLIFKKYLWLCEQQKVIVGEEKLITDNTKLGSSQEGVSVTELKNLAAFFNLRVSELKKQYFDLEQEKAKLTATRTRILNQMGQMNVNATTPSGQIIVEVTSTSAISANFELSYVVTNVSWSPVYDIYSDGVKKDVTIVYKANVYQNTGIDWKNVKLTINTGNPNSNNSRPILYPRYLSVYSPTYTDYGRKDKSVSYENMMVYDAAPAPEAVNKYKAEEKLDESYVPMVVVENATNIEFKVDQEYNIPADGQLHLVTMSENSIPAEYEYHSVPSVDNAAFLLARVTEWGKLNLLAANANIFLDDTYIGQSYLDPYITSDTLFLSFGQDDKIIVSREKVFTECKVSTVMGNKKHQIMYEIKIRNTKSTNVKISVMDQIPLSNMKDVEVELIDKGGAEFEAIIGRLMWDVELKPNESKTIRFSYTVKHPKNIVIQGI